MKIDYDFIEKSLKECLNECEELKDMCKIDDYSDEKTKQRYIINISNIQTMKRENLKLLKDLYSTIAKSETKEQNDVEELTIDSLHSLLNKDIA